ncbi:hypothetical protein EYF80_066003 [Liparis tanakae]|uniref:Uncharacterized protein n=1 Tax=Liparis tanakae TaxID=230148 RepID=A0A4Z2E5I6_9TELE|nr:hypothetical protein EYF80_066003 [Liparis tanakae]
MAEAAGRRNAAAGGGVQASDGKAPRCLPSLTLRGRGRVIHHRRRPSGGSAARSSYVLTSGGDVSGGGERRSNGTSAAFLTLAYFNGRKAEDSDV